MKRAPKKYGSQKAWYILEIKNYIMRDGPTDENIKKSNSSGVS